MIRINVLCEGQTEEMFVKRVMYEYFLRLEILLIPIVIKTGPAGKGGVVSWGKAENQIIRLCKSDPKAFTTTFFDLYGLPDDWPGKESAVFEKTPHSKGLCIENAMSLAINLSNFIPNMIVHEFEGLLFSNPDCFKTWCNEAVVSQLRDMRESCISPEHINDSPITAPSKRILKLIPSYKKVVQGSSIANEIGLDQIKVQCEHFNYWLETLTNCRL